MEIIMVAITVITVIIIVETIIVVIIIIIITITIITIIMDFIIGCGGCIAGFPFMYSVVATIIIMEDITIQLMDIVRHAIIHLII